MRKLIIIVLTLAIIGFTSGCSKTVEGNYDGINKYIYDGIANSPNHEIKIGVQNIFETRDSYGKYYDMKIYKDEDKNKTAIPTYDFEATADNVNPMGDIHYAVYEPYVNYIKDDNSYILIKDTGKYENIFWKTIPIYSVKIYASKSNFHEPEQAKQQ
jgi:hypothetical protein